MRLLVLTNLYPPQELGGYGRCIADFVWGLHELGHSISVLTTDAPYLCSLDQSIHESQKHVDCIARELLLKGSYENGVSFITDGISCGNIDRFNIEIIQRYLNDDWDGILLGNIDLLGVEILPILLEKSIPILHHIGFICPPFPFDQLPTSPHYHILTASNAVKNSLLKAGYPSSIVVYPGARCELFSPKVGSLSDSLSFASASIQAGQQLGSASNPLKIGFAGLIMGSKGLHTVAQSLIQLHSEGYCILANFAGADFQPGYKARIESLLYDAGILHSVSFVGQLDRQKLSRFWSLHHIGIFPSIHPEAFGIVAAEIMASGVALLTTGVGGASELIEPYISGLRFLPDNPSSLTNALKLLLSDNNFLLSIASNGFFRANREFSAMTSAILLQDLFASFSSDTSTFSINT